MTTVKGFRLGDLGDVVSPRVVITMPAYNAEATLARTIADIPAGIADQLILVDDASPDNTAELARALGVEVHVHPLNRGYGGNQKTCYTTALRADADIVVMLHPDYQYEPKAVPLLIAPILAGDADMTFGSRFAGLGNPRSGGMPIQRYVGNRVTTILENLMLGSRFSEMHSGMRAYTRQCLLSLPFLRYSDDFVFDSQLLIEAVTIGQRVVEVPIPTRYSDESSSIGALRSLSYVAGSLGYCARRVWQHGRTRHRSPIGRPDTKSRHVRPGESARERVCVLCGAPRPHWSLAGGTLLECAVCGLVASSETQAQAARSLHGGSVLEEDYAFIEWILDALSGYVLQGRRLLALGMSDPRIRERLVAAGWEPVESTAMLETTDGSSDGVDALLLLAVTEQLLNRPEGLRGLRSLVEPEGMFALVAPCETGYRRGPGPLPYYLRAESLDGALRDADFRLVEWTHLPRSHARDYGRSLADGTRTVRDRRSAVALVMARPIPVGSPPTWRRP